MRIGFFLRTFFLTIILAGVLAVIIATMHSSFTATPKQQDTHTFFEQFVVAGGPIVWFVLLPMSVVMVYLAVKHALIIRRTKLLPEAVGEEIVDTIQQFGLDKLESQVAGQNDFVSTAVVRAVAQGRGDWFRMRNALAESLQDQASQLLRSIEWLSLIGSVSPMVGLFGTVFGMIKLFNAIVIAGGQPQPVQLAAGISVALVTTFWGLFIAIPALAIHGVFRNRIETFISDAVQEAESIMPQIRRCLRKQTQSQPPKQAQPIATLPPKPDTTTGKSSQTLRQIK